MKYFFGARFVVEPIRIQRLERERQAERSGSYQHHVNPMRQVYDEMSLRAEIETPCGLTDDQQKAVERALDRMLEKLRRYIAEEFEMLDSDR